MKNICIFSAQYLPHTGGVERYTYNLAKKLIEHGNSVTVVASQIDQAPEYEISDGIEIYRLPAIQLLGGRYPIIKKNDKYREQMKKLAEKKYDLVICQTRFYTHSLEGLRFAKRSGIKSIVIEHGTAHLSVGNKLLDFCGGIYEHIFTIPVKRLAGGFYGVSNECNLWSAHFGIRSAGVLYNAVDIDYIESLLAAPKRDFISEYGIKENENTVCFIGRLVWEKGVRQFIESAKRINSGEKKTHFFIAGDGELYDELSALSDEYIHLTGRLDFDEVISLLKISDIFCLPSESEGFPTSVLEAIACGVFVITTFRGGAKEIICDDSSGIILKENTADAITDAIRIALGDPDYRKSAAASAYDRMKAGFTWENTACAVEKICSAAK